MAKSTRKGVSKPHIEIEVAPSRGGLSINIRSNRLFHYEIRYFALGTAGHQRSGNLRGNVRTSLTRRFVDLGFDVVIAGITWHRLSFGSAGSSVDVGPVLPTEPSFRSMHPSSTLSSPVQFPREAQPGGRRRSSLTGDTYAGYADTYELYHDQYDQYGMYAEIYQDAYGIYFDAYDEIAPGVKDKPRAKRKKPTRRKQRRAPTHKKRTKRKAKSRSKAKISPKRKRKARTPTKASVGTARSKGRKTKRNAPSGRRQTK
jgi:hypothetical protein